MPQVRFTFSWDERIHKQKEFKHILKSGRRLFNPALLIYVCSNDKPDAKTRLGLVTSGKIGNAVKRNRIKRLLREAFRLNKHRIKPGTDVIFMPKKDSIGLDFDKIQNIVLKLLDKAGLLEKKDV